MYLLIIEAFGGSSVSSWANYQSPRAGTLSVLSDDSFMSAFEEFVSVLLCSNVITHCVEYIYMFLFQPVVLDEEGRDVLSLNQNELVFYMQGYEVASKGEVRINIWAKRFQTYLFYILYLSVSCLCLGKISQSPY